MSKRGKLGFGRKILVVMVALTVGLAIVGPASAGVAQSPAETQYNPPPPPAANPPASPPPPAANPPASPPPPAANPDAEPQAEPQTEPQAEPEIFLPPTVASAGQDDSADSGGLLPFTGAALIVPSVLGGLLLAGGLFLVYRTRRREEL